MSKAVEILKSSFGYNSFRGKQEAIVDHVSQGQSCFVLMQTGGGKSLCYQVPGLMREGVAIVVSPLISLMKDQVDALVRKDISAAYLSTSQSADEKKDILSRALRGQLTFL